MLLVCNRSNEFVPESIYAIHLDNYRTYFTEIRQVGMVTVWKILITIIVTEVIMVLLKCAANVSKKYRHNKSLQQVLHLKKKKKINK